MRGIGWECFVFFQSVLSGMILYCFYLCIRKFRNIIKHTSFWISTEDLLYWIIASFYITAQIMQCNDGNIRWYFVAGILSGVFLCIVVELRIVKKR